MKVNDKVFGELEFDLFWSRPYLFEIFGQTQKVELVVQTFDDDEITDNQRQTFNDLEKNKAKVASDIQVAVFEYYKENFESSVSSISEVAGLVDLKKVKIMHSDDGEDREVGFIFNADFDPELGVGVLVTNGEVEEVDVQDIVLG